MNKLLFLLFLLPLTAIAADVSNPKVPPQWQTCAMDSECTLVVRACGTWLAVNRYHEEQANSFLDVNHLIPDPCVVAGKPPANAACRHSTCTGTTP